MSGDTTTRSVPVPVAVGSDVEQRSAWRGRHFAGIVVVGLIQAVARAQAPTTQDIYWEARFGLTTLHSGYLPSTDTYSWTAHGAGWITSSWLWNIVLASAYRLFSIAGFWILAGAVAAGLALAVAVLARRIGASPVATIAAFVPLGYFADIAIPRAQSVSNIVILIIPLLLARLLYGSRRTAAVTTLGLAVLQILWINLHSMALLGPPLILVGGLGLIAGNFRSRGRAGIMRALGATVVTALCCLVTPYGVSLVRHAGEVRSASTGLITEWEPVGFGSPTQIAGVLVVICLGALALAPWRHGRFDLAAQLLLLAVLAVTALRFLPMAAALATAELGLVAGRLKVRRKLFGLMIGIGTVAMMAPALMNGRDLDALEPVVSPQLIREVPVGCRVLNDDTVGSAIALERPDVAISLDGRNDMYGRDVVMRVIGYLLDRPGTQAELASHHVDCILAPTQLPIVRRLRNDPQWAVRGSDSFRTLLLRQPSGSDSQPRP